ncbi:MAG: hypothetical protein AAFU72_07605 [Pseudomonadota bacterium]
MSLYGTLAVLTVAAALGGTAVSSGADDLWNRAEAAYAEGDCSTASPLYRSLLKGEPRPARRIAATHALSLCVATPEDPWEARELMAELLPIVLQHFGPQSSGLARHHAIWAETEVRAAALDVAWRRSEAAIKAARSAGAVDPFDHAAELYRLAAIQLARGKGDLFIAFFETERARLTEADWATDGDGELFDEVTEGVPAPGDEEALADWVRRGLEEFDPRPLYLTLVDLPA